MVIDIFCDASIDLNTKLACGGCYIASQDERGHLKDITYSLILQEGATNNSGEILAIYSGVVNALKLRRTYPHAIIRLFSDSKISLYGVRDWIKSWIANMNSDGELISSSGQVVKNQQKFIDVYNLIVENNLFIEFYHQRGHVLEKRIPYQKARAEFIKANKVSPENMGISIESLCAGNDKIDKLTRDAIYFYLGSNQLPANTIFEGINPMAYSIRADKLDQYMRCIDKTSVRSRHNFKGGYNQ